MLKHRLWIAAFYAVLFAACNGTSSEGRSAPVNLTIASREVFAAALPADEYVISITITGKKYSAHKKTNLSVSKVVFPAVPLGEEITVKAIVFPLGPKTGSPQLWYGVYPAGRVAYKVDAIPQTLSIELQAMDTKARGGTIHFMDKGEGEWDEMHVFEAAVFPQTLEFDSAPNVDASILVVAGGGGGGGGGAGGGGGGGGVIYREGYKLNSNVYAIQVGSGGNGGDGTGTPGTGVDGALSEFSAAGTPVITVLGGGGGGGGMTPGNDAPVMTPPVYDVCGGGGGGGGAITTYPPGTGGKSVGAPGYGQNGGSGSNAGSGGAGGGGGGGGRGGIGINAAESTRDILNLGNVTGAYGGHGGAGISSELNGSLVYYGGGGGGCGTFEPGDGGRGGGGKGAIASLDNSAVDGEAGKVGSGGGGGGGFAGGDGGKGGDGVVIIRFPFSLP